MLIYPGLGFFHFNHTIFQAGEKLGWEDTANSTAIDCKDIECSFHINLPA
jgi:hypothetical protein